MKNILKLIGTIALVAVIGFSMACGDDDGGITTIPVTGVTLNKNSISLKVGETETLTATVAPDNATNKAVTWSSSDATKATVSEGVVTAVAAGTATITVTTADGSKTAQCTVTVTSVGSDDDSTDEDKPQTDYRWVKGIDKEGDPSLSDNAISYSVDSSGNVTVISRETSSTSWYIQVKVKFTAKENSKYRLSFDLQSKEGEERVTYQENIDLFFGLEPNAFRTNIDCKEVSQTYSFTLPEKANIGDELRVDFNCGKKTGTFYIRNLSIIPLEMNAWDGSTVEENGSITITYRYNGAGGNITIPAQIDGKPVTSIGEWAFDGCTSLTSW